MRKKLLLYLPLPLIVIGVLVFYNFQGPNWQENIASSALSVTLVKGTAKIYVDGNYMGQTPLKYAQVKTGVHDIKLVRGSNYPDFKTEVDFYSGTSAYIDWDQGPSTQFSSGYITYLLPYTSGKYGVYFQTETSDVYLDNKLVGNGNFVLNSLDNKIYSVKVSKNGYDPLTFNITPQKGYMLVAKVQLFMVPYKAI